MIGDAACHIADNVFAIDIGINWNVGIGRLWLVYSPLSGCKIIVTTSDLEKIKENIRLRKVNDVVKRLLSQKPVVAKHHTDFDALYVVPTNECNFSCKYCFSAKYHGHHVLSESAMISFLEYFLRNKYGRRHVKIVFAGGGEPLLAWDIVAAGITRIRELESLNHVLVDIYIITNISQITDQKITFCQQNNVRITASFDILEAVQNRQRGGYDRVFSRLKKIDESALKYQIQATIMPDSVDLLSDMIVDVAHNFPSAQGIVFEMMRGGEVFKTAKDIDTYIQRFWDEWRRAKKVAEKCEVKIFNSFVATKDIVRDHFCGGIFVLTPYGDITTCIHISDIEQKGYADSKIGYVDGKEVVILENEFKRAYSRCEVRDPACMACWARWNCAGGCPKSRHMYSEEVRSAICRNMKGMLAEMLIDDLRQDLKIQRAEDLDQMICDNYTRGRI